MSRRTNSWNAYRSTLTSEITASATDIPVEAIEDELAYPAYLVMDPDSPTKREYIKVIGRNGSSFDTGTTGNRGLDGSVGGDAQGHLAGATMRAVSVKQWLDDIFDDIEDLEDIQGDYLLLAGGTMAGAIDMGGSNQINLLANGTADQDAATLKQVTDGDDGVTAAFEAADLVVTAAFEAADLLLLDLAGTRPMTGALLHIDGTAADPAITFDSDPDTGMYLLADNVIGWAVNNVEAMSLGNGLRVGPSSEGAAFMTTATPSASGTAYGFNGESGLGLYRSSAGRLAFAVGGSQVMGLISTGLDMLDNKLLNVADGTVNTDGVNFNQVRTQPTDTSANLNSPWTGTVAFRRTGRVATLTVIATRSSVTINGGFTIINTIPLEFQSAGSTVFFQARVQFTSGVDTNAYKYAHLQMSPAASIITVETRIENTTSMRFTATYICNGE